MWIPYDPPTDLTRLFSMEDGKTYTVQVTDSSAWIVLAVVDLGDPPRAPTLVDFDGSPLSEDELEILRGEQGWAGVDPLPATIVSPFVLRPLGLPISLRQGDEATQRWIGRARDPDTPFTQGCWLSVLAQ